MTIAITIQHVGHRTLLLALSGKLLLRVTLVGTVTGKLMAHLFLSISLSWTGEKSCVEHSKKTCWEQGTEILSLQNIVIPSVIIKQTMSGFLGALTNKRDAFMQVTNQNKGRDYQSHWVLRIPTRSMVER